MQKQTNKQNHFIFISVLFNSLIHSIIELKLVGKLNI